MILGYPPEDLVLRPDGDFEDCAQAWRATGPPPRWMPGRAHHLPVADNGNPLQWQRCGMEAGESNMFGI